VSLAKGSSAPAAPGRVAKQVMRVTNTGQGEDLIRVKASTAFGWATAVESNVLDVPAGATVDVPVYVSVPKGSRASTTLTFKASSETDATKSATSTATITPGR
jgi:uncharacterized membrane protein